MRRRGWILSCIGVLILSMLTGCASDEANPANALENTEQETEENVNPMTTIPLYFTNKSFDDLYKVEWDVNLTEMNPTQKIRTVLRALQDESGEMRAEAEDYDGNLYAVVPNGLLYKAEYKAVFTGIEGSARIVVTFLKSLDSLTQNQRVILYTGISQALLALNIAPSVEFYDQDSEDALYTAKKTQEVSINIYDEEYFTGTETVNLYFANSSGTALYREKRDIYLGVTDSLAKVVMQALIAGPKEAEGISTIPTGTTVNDIFVKDNICYLDLSSEFQRNYIGGETMEKLTIYSVVNSLCGVPGINKVQILIDGKRVDTYKFSVSLSSFFERDYSIVE